jgi:hypothetical protein
MQKLGRHIGQILDSSVYISGMQIRTDHVRPESDLRGSFNNIPVERALSVAHVEQNTSFLRPKIFVMLKFFFVFHRIRFLYRDDYFESLLTIFLSNIKFGAVAKLAQA